MSNDDHTRADPVAGLTHTATLIDSVLTHAGNLLAAGDVDSARLALRTLYGVPSLLRRIARDIQATDGPTNTGPDPLPSTRSGRDRHHLAQASHG